jgi:hypothetical protein
VVAFFVGVPLGILSVAIALMGVLRYEPKSRVRRIAARALVVGGLGLGVGLFVWFVHIRAIQVAYSVPSRGEMAAEFERNVVKAAAPLPSAPPRSVPAAGSTPH